MRDSKMVGAGMSYIESFIGTPYKWAGDDPMAGFDCSGLVLEMLWAVGVFVDGYDMTAQGIWKRLQHSSILRPIRGALVFFGTTNKVTHVGICINDKLMLEAGGGGSKTVTTQDAIDSNAYVRVRPIARRTDVVGFCDPFLNEIN